MASALTLTSTQDASIQTSLPNIEHDRKRRGAFLVALLLFILLDNAVFRSGWYQRFVEPNSSIGMYRFQRDQAFLKEKQRGHLVAFVGDSRMMEGFSLKGFDEAAVGTPYKPVLLALPGSTLRVWYYLLKQVDPDHKAFDAIVVPMNSYSNVDEKENENGDMNERALDVSFLAPYLSFTDSIDLMNTYRDLHIKSTVLLGALLKSYAYRMDLRDFLMHPQKRLEKVRGCKRSGASSLYQYRGHPESLLGLKTENGKISKGTSVLTETVLERLNQRVFDPLPPQVGNQKRYNDFWLQRLDKAYSDGNTRIVFFKPPTDAMPRKCTMPEELSTINASSRQKNVLILAKGLFDDLEAPEYFFDDLHLNLEGRHRFTKRLAETILHVLGDGKTSAKNPPGSG